MDSVLKIGVAGAPRGKSFTRAVSVFPDVKVAAICDLNQEALAKAKEELGEVETCDDFDKLVEMDIDAIVVATPMPLHAPQCIQAMENGKHVLSEVPAATDLEQCRDLLNAVKRTGKTYMMAENYCYMKANMLVGELVKRGLFGDIYFGEGEYLHELKELNEITPWRRKWQTGVNGCTYGTHSLGPVLQWFNDSVAEVSCVGSGHHYRDPRGDYYENEDTIFMMCRLKGGALVKVRVDMLSNRPHMMTYYSLQGTKGCYEAPRGFGDGPKIWLSDFHESRKMEWHSLWDFEEHLPDIWRNPPEELLKSGHGGGDYIEALDFITAVKNNTPPPIDIYAALDFTVPGLVSLESIRRGGEWLLVPDFRKNSV